ncbi:hypothetical protein Cch01nite_05940 [Cellulomonas chitinilytica]|uniref:Uncharacterized protein n=1 Tax=Cellulomonas chitinilytica TaxID=398759 RepID=A0A919NZH0_9CELL|nr:hypothetical protein [Cellulomonas chitinilytica]GIG19870.1 hypothetical protein Cch01nite_05940 [Cellulomonas chitinilytica]
MARFDVQASFLINQGHPDAEPGPEALVALSVIDEAGSPVELDIALDDEGRGQVTAFIILNVNSTETVPLRIAASYPTAQPGFYVIAVRPRTDLGPVGFEDYHPATLGIAVTTEDGRGQTLAVNSLAAHVQPQNS